MMASNSLCEFAGSELAAERKERRLQRRRELDKARHAAESSQKREERLAIRRVRDRAKRAAQSEQEGRAVLQSRRARLNNESDQQREASQNVEEISWLLNRLKRDKPGYRG